MSFLNAVRKRSIETKSFFLFQLRASELALVLPLGILCAATLLRRRQETCWKSFKTGADFAAVCNGAFQILAYCLCEGIRTYVLPNDSVAQQQATILLYSPLVIPVFSTMALVALYPVFTCKALFSKKLFWIGGIAMNILIQCIWNIIGLCCLEPYQRNFTNSVHEQDGEEPYTPTFMILLVLSTVPAGVLPSLLDVLSRKLFLPETTEPAREPLIQHFNRDEKRTNEEEDKREFFEKLGLLV